MRPYYQEDGITIYHGDSREVLPCVDFAVAITDPPYGIQLANHNTGNHSARPDPSLQDYQILGDGDAEIGELVLAYLAARPVIAFASPRRPWPGHWRQYLVWDKGPALGGGGDPDKCWKLDWELIQVARTGPLNGARDSSILRFDGLAFGEAQHPAQKPLPLLEYLIHKASMEGDTIIDPFMGSGTTVVAAKSTGRRAIGIEVEERYCEIAAKRLAQGVLAF